MKNIYKFIFSLFSTHFNFPPDFFETTNPKEIKSKSPGKVIFQKKENTSYKPKSICIDITKDDEEDKELLDLLEGKRKFYMKLIKDIIFLFSLYKSK